MQSPNSKTRRAEQADVEEQPALGGGVWMVRVAHPREAHRTLAEQSSPNEGSSYR